MLNSKKLLKKICYKSSCPQEIGNVDYEQEFYDARYPGYFLNTYFICLDYIKDKEISGRIYHGYIDKEYRFHSLVDLLSVIDRTCGRLQAPQASVCLRSFARTNHKTKAQFDMKIRPRFPDTIEDAFQYEGIVDTIILKILYRQHATWQGLLETTSGIINRPFCSELQFVRIVDLICNKV